MPSFPTLKFTGRNSCSAPALAARSKPASAVLTRMYCVGLAEQTIGVLYEDGGAKAIRTDWRQRVKVMRPVVAEEEANNAGVTAQDVALAAKSSFEGVSVGVYREHDELLPILFRAPEEERSNVASVNNLQIWSPLPSSRSRLRQVRPEF